ncbi:hypothetical protein E3N88_05472 [Mikania micrantha]|uniref:NADP-dependent oxidoreductase domain-containing protein n=1 Tax=Mikania micrantha TaxID=192012 RepID=A0A5N6PLR2_9ASTR|nr:hypothetical protein E3N88_05472 [Mikania micrantha]
MQALKDGMREKVEVATKFGIKCDGVWEVNGHPAYVRAACEAKASTSTIRRAHAVHPIYAIQLEWSLWSRDIEKDIIHTCRELGIGIVAYSPLGRGFFSSGLATIEKLEDYDCRKHCYSGVLASIGTKDAFLAQPYSRFEGRGEVATKFGVKYDGSWEVKGDPAYVRAACEASLQRLDVDCIDLYYQDRIDTGVPIEITYMPRFQPENLLYNKILYKRVNEIASKTRCTPSQLSLAWLHHQGNDVIPIPGTTKIENLEQNTGVLSVKLTPEEMTELECIASAGSVKGDRYGAGISTYLDSETPMLSSWQAMLRAV